MTTKGAERGFKTMKRERVTLRKRGQFTLPKSIMEKLNLQEGDSFDLEVDNAGRVTLIPLIQIPVDQAWFWSERWQKEEQEAQKDIEEGRIHSFTDIEEAFNWLDSEDEE